jgi:hypothetical protein
MFEDAERATWEERQLNERDRDYYDGKQLTLEERNALKKRGQPPVVFNRIRRKVNFMMGTERQQRRDPRAFPRTPTDEPVAQSASDALRFVCDSEDWDRHRSLFAENLFIEGTGATMVGIKEDKQGLTPTLINIPWDRFFYDPHSRDPHFGDATYLGLVTWYDIDKARAMYPEAEEVLTATLSRSRHSETYDDRPKWRIWSDYERQRVRICEVFFEEGGVWQTAIFTEAGNITEAQPSPYLDENGEPECPIRAASLYVDRDNNRYGDIRDSIDPQDEVNKRRSKGLHLINSRQVRVGPDATQGPDVIRKELARPDGVITSGDVEILNTNDMAAQNLQMLQEAKNEIDLMGANAALQGKNEADMSGRAILAQQQGGMVEIGLHMDRIRQHTIEVYEALWSRIRQTWKGERWVRVTDDERSVRFVGINQPVTAADMMMEQISQDPQAQQRIQKDPMAQQRLQEFLQSPQAQSVVEVRNVPSEIDVDIVIDEGMDTPTVQAEQFDTLSKILPGLINLPPVYAQMLVQASSLRDKDKILETLEAQQQQDPMAEQMKQIAMAKEVAEVEKTQSEAAENAANAVRNQAEAFKTGVEAGMAA